MPNEKKFDSGPAVIPVAHPNGEVHNIAVPPDTPLADLHFALSDYSWGKNPPYLGANVDALGHPKKGPNKDGVLENTPDFKKAARAVWDAAGRGRNTNEAGVYLDENNKAAPVQVSDKDGKASLRVPTSSKMLLHSHPNTAGGQPSDQDIESAKKLGKTIYVVSKSGLQGVDKFGKVTAVYSNPDWMKK